MRVLTLPFLGLLLLMASCQKNKTIVSSRNKMNLNASWQYTGHRANNPEELNDTFDWQSIDLPHTWNTQDVMDDVPGYRRDMGWYRKNLVIPEIDPEQTYTLYFEGANITTKCYVNGTLVGQHIGGYLGFEFDITNHIKEGKNEIMVRVDNDHDPEIIPSHQSDFFIYGGITRDVWLITKSKTAINSLQLTTPEVSEEYASLVAALTITLPKEDYNNNFDLVLILTDSDGKKVWERKQAIQGENVTIRMDSLKQPQLWHVDHPNLYTVTAILEKDGKPIDEVLDRIGFRWFEFKDHGPFYLNGERLLLRGTHRHEEHAGVGAAMSNEQHRNDMEQIKEMGANFVRLAHYPQDPEVYRACDELGLLVWDELPWCRGGVGNATWKTNTRNMLREMITQNFNHPSIILWSLGNEMYWLPEFEHGDDTEALNTFLSELNDTAHQMDPSRKTVIRKYYEGAHIVDVFSPSIWSGWYSGNYKNYETALKTSKAKYKHFLHAEYGGSSHVGRHTENPITGEGKLKSDEWEEPVVQTGLENIANIGDWSETYIVDLFDWHLRLSETDSTFVGNAQWAFKDFGTPLRPENDIPYVNQKGLVDRDGNPKDAYYVFKSYWSKTPFVYIESKTWTERQGPRGKKRTISVYSNCKTVKLLHNGTDLGTKERDIEKFPASGLNWEIDFAEGDTNTLVAIGHMEGSSVKDTLNVTYRFTKNDVAKKLVLQAEKLKNGNYLITATAQDGAGLRCLDYEERVYFQCLQGGSTIKNQGTPTGSETIAMANGKAQIEVVPDTTDTSLKVMVLNQNFKGTYLTVNKENESNGPIARVKPNYLLGFIPTALYKWCR